MMATSLDRMPALLLNADYRPMSYVPISTINWQDAVRAKFLDRVEVLAEYDRVIRSQRESMNLPSVVCLRDYVRLDRPAALTRINLLVRDRFTCQYCGRRFPTSELTFDHVIPRSRGGSSCWRNLIASCAPCNASKGDMLPRECGMHPLKTPVHPTLEDLNRVGETMVMGRLHESWLEFLPKTKAALEDRIMLQEEGRAFPSDMSSKDYWTVELEL
jgi:5-methylcytosine-specific restriction endonuclease McrA